MCLKTMWVSEEDTRHDMIEIVHFLYLLKTRPCNFMLFFDSQTWLVIFMLC